MSKVLFAVRIGNEDWQEELITEHEDRIEAASEWAKANGFDRLRVAEIDDDPPDFIQAMGLKNRREEARHEY